MIEDIVSVTYSFKYLHTLTKFIENFAFIEKCIEKMPSFIFQIQLIFRFLGGNLSIFFFLFYGKLKAQKRHSEIN